jgi:nucleoside 2-deoxyribosyltransferase
MTDVYNYGIQQPVHAAGYLCGRVDYQSFVGDIVAQIKSQIDKADFVIADLTGANPNVYLEVGYAWGRGITAILTIREAREVERELKFDVRGQRCLVYKNITHLEEQLAKELSALKVQQVIGPTSRR